MPKTDSPGLVLTHGAGSNRDAPLLLSVEEAFGSAGYLTERVNLWYRQHRPTGPPRRGDAEKDRQVLREAAGQMRSRTSGPVIIGGASYGGRQASMLVADEPALADGLLLLSYPLHPPGKPERARTEHLPRIEIPALFVHGTRDPFGSIEELRTAIALTAGRTDLIVVEPAGHDLKKGRGWEKGPLVSFFEGLRSAAGNR